MSEHDFNAPMKPCLHCGHKAPTVAQIAGKPPRNTGGDADADKTYFGLCVNPACFARGPEAGSKEEAIARWNKRFEEAKGSENASKTGCSYWVKDYEGTLSDGTGHIEAWSGHKAGGPAPSPWYDASEVSPLPCRRCVVEWRPYRSFDKFYDVYYYDSIRRAWIGSNGNATTDLFVAERWKYLDVGQ